MDDDSPYFWIGQQPTLTIYITYLKATGEDWHRFLVEAVTPEFSAKFECEAIMFTLKNFREQVLAMYETLKGTAHLVFTEDSVEINATIDKLGHVFWDIKLRNNHPAYPALLTFRIEEDQTLLWNVAAKIEEIIENT